MTLEIVEQSRNVVNFQDVFMVKLARDRQKICRCEGAGLEVDVVNRIVACSTCGAILDPFDALVRIAEGPERLLADMEKIRERRRDLMREYCSLARRKPGTLIFRELERSYRRHRGARMLPLCPECSRPFRFEDVTSWMSEKYCLREERQ